jgi:tetratricopeptide (TPR) repeat protein
MIRSSTTLAVGLALVLAAGDVRAAPEPAPPVSEDPAQIEAKALYEEGLALYNTFDYEGAIKAWTRAYGKLPASEANAAARNALVYNIASAQEKAFEQDKDVVHLVRAKSLLEVYVEENLAAGGTDEADLAKARERIAAFDERIRVEQARAEKAKNTPREPNSQPTHPQPEGKREGVGLVAGGSVLLGLGAATLIGGVTAGALEAKHASDAIGGLDALGDEAERQRQLDRGKRGDTIVIATAVSGGVAAVAGVVMVAIGATRMRKSSGKATPKNALLPSFGRGWAGLAWSTRF